MTDPTALHDQSFVIDGLNTCNWSRAIFQEMREGNVTAVNCASLLWENFRGGIDYVSMWQRFFRENADLIRPVRSVGDIRRAKEERRTGIIIGWQNTSPIEDRLDYIEIFRNLGVGVMQLTYNTQNYAGAGYLEDHDSGLTGFGCEMVAEMNRVGILCDLSHVGEKTAMDVVEHSSRPVAVTHVLPKALKDVPRNKSDALFKVCAAKGGVIGVSLFSPGLVAGNEATVDDYLDAMAYVIDQVGEDHVGLGTDFSLDHARPGPWLLWANRDKGTARTLTEFGNVRIEKPKGIERINKMHNVTTAMVARGWSETTIRKLLGANWMRVLTAVWGD